MNFTDAVRELEEGRCEKIESIDFEHEDITYTKADGFLESSNSPGELRGPSHLGAILGEWRLVGEKPQMDEVIVKEWRRFVKGQATQHIYRSMSEASLNGEFDAAETTVTYFRPVPRKVKRREEITPLSRTYNTVTCRSVIGAKVMDSSMKFYREWEEEVPK